MTRCSPKFGHLSVVMAPPPIPNMVFLAPSCPIIVLLGEPRVTRIDRMTSPARKKTIEGQLRLILDSGKWRWWEADLETFHSFLAALWVFQKQRDRRGERWTKAFVGSSSHQRALAVFSSSSCPGLYWIWTRLYWLSFIF